ncbi:PEGA domain-containing protein [Gemmatimonas groenlandica]|uniref:PEGA domain-containing protein n=1 Tax=Gemmatimonas groenlandica TaxID=2732249 RepID=A0A6M4ISU1_9BACT|nr:PEGA domain-containing protein [Gemmatimonas groenlandica]QJR35892.1 PEGA domain-containing protein [Gemmatimonas groenlandica]
MKNRPYVVPLVVGLFVGGCAHSAPGTSAGASVNTSSAASTCASANGVGKLRLSLTLQPAVSETTEALVRLESETERSTVRVNATLGTTFELRPGTYRLSISLPGYNNAERTAIIDCGSDKALTVQLTRKR